MAGCLPAVRAGGAELGRHVPEQNGRQLLGGDDEAVGGQLRLADGLVRMRGILVIAQRKGLPCQVSTSTRPEAAWVSLSQPSLGVAAFQSTETCQRRAGSMTSIASRPR